MGPQPADLQAVQQRVHEVMQTADGSLPSKEDAEEFVSKVDDVFRLIEGLSEGTISADYVDRKMNWHPEADATANEQCKKATVAAHHIASNPPAADNKSNQGVLDEQKHAQLVQKVADIKANLDRKRAARARYDAHVAANPTAAATDYFKWDLWCPEDEEDELVASCTPNSAAFVAMEKDIDARHERMVKQRQIAERCRVAGNEAFKQGQWADALRQYEAGLDAERSNAKLQCNAAAAALKLGCFVKAAEHCDRVVRLLEFLLERPQDPLLVKALQRRAAARTALGMHKEAVQDLERALELQPADGELGAQLQRARAALQEHGQLKELQAARSADAQPARTARLDELRQLERWALQMQRAKAKQPQGMGLRGPTLTGVSHGTDWRRVASLAAKVEAQVKGRADLRLYFRHCGGVQTTAKLICVADKQPQGPAFTDGRHACLRLLNEACQTDSNALAVLGCDAARGPSAAGKQLLAACAAALHSSGAAASVALLHTLTTNSEARPAVAAALAQVCPGAGSPGGASLPPQPAGAGAPPGAPASSATGAAKASPLGPADAGSSGAAALLHALPQLSEPQLALALALLSNCAVHKPFAAALGQLLSAKAHVQSLTNLLASATAPLIIERLASLLGNAVGDAAVRSAVCASGAVIPALVRRASALSKQQSAGAQAALVACLTCLYNIAADSNTHSAVLDAGFLADAARVLGARHTAAVRCAGVVARLAKAPTSWPLASECGLPERLLEQLFAAGASLGADAPGGRGAEASAGSSQARAGAAAWQADAAAQFVENAVRVIATWGAAAGRSLLLRADVQRLLLWACASARVLPGTAGNAALCLSYIAGDRQEMVKMRDAQAVSILTGCAYAQKGSAGARNAAIALAKLAQDPICMQQLKDCHGLEVIYQYVKP